MRINRGSCSSLFCCPLPKIKPRHLFGLALLTAWVQIYSGFYSLSNRGITALPLQADPFQPTGVLIQALPRVSDAFKERMSSKIPIGKRTLEKVKGSDAPKSKETPQSFLKYITPRHFEQFKRRTTLKEYQKPFFQEFLRVLADPSLSFDGLEKFSEKMRCLNIQDEHSDTLLYRSIKEGRSDLAKFLIHQGAHLSHIDAYQRWNVLGAATLWNRIGLVESLLEEGIEIEESGHGSFSPYMLSLILDHQEISQRLLSYGATIHQVLPNGKTPLHTAVEVAVVTPGRPEWATKFIEAGADPFFMPEGLKKTIQSPFSELCKHRSAKKIEALKAFTKTENVEAFKKCDHMFSFFQVLIPPPDQMTIAIWGHKYDKTTKEEFLLSLRKGEIGREEYAFGVISLFYEFPSDVYDRGKGSRDQIFLKGRWDRDYAGIYLGTHQQWLKERIFELSHRNQTN